MASRASTVDAVRELILAGQYAPGERLGEVELAGALGVSRTPVREALRHLAAEGIVELTPNKGARVVEWSPAELEQVFELRARVEGLAARLAAESATDAHLDELQRVAEEHLEAARPSRRRDLDRVYALNHAFHDGVVEAAGGATLRAVVSGLVRTPVLVRTLHVFDDAAMERSSRHHLELVAAMRAHDPDWAESVMRAHLLAARAALLGQRRRPGVAPDGATTTPSTTAPDGEERTA